MIDFVKNITIRKFWFLNLLNDQNGYLFTSGWINSFKKKKPFDTQSNPIPWFTLPAVDFITDKLSSELTVLEYGSGNSTLFFCQKCASVTSIENNKEWFEYIKSKIPSNGCVLICTESDYPSQIQELLNSPDVVIIDGILREKCIEEVLKVNIKPSILILDDSERKAYEQSQIDLLKNGYKKIDFWGMAPGLSYKKCTSIFYTHENCFGI